MTSAEASQLRKTAQAFVDGYNAWNIDAILAPRADNCTQRVLPLRLDRPTLNNEQYREFFDKRVIPHFSNFKVEVIDVVEDQQNNKVALQAKSSAETALGPYGNEYMIILHMTSDHSQIVEIKEFVDSEYSQGFFSRQREYLEKTQGQK